MEMLQEPQEVEGKCKNNVCNCYCFAAVECKQQGQSGACFTSGHLRPNWWSQTISKQFVARQTTHLGAFQYLWAPQTQVLYKNSSAKLLLVLVKTHTVKHYNCYRVVTENSLRPTPHYITPQLGIKWGRWEKRCGVPWFWLGGTPRCWCEGRVLWEGWVWMTAECPEPTAHSIQECSTEGRKPAEDEVKAQF